MTIPLKHTKRRSVRMRRLKDRRNSDPGRSVSVSLKGGRKLCPLFAAKRDEFRCYDRAVTPDPPPYQTTLDMNHDLARVSPIYGAQRRILEAIAARVGLGEHARS